MDRSARILRPEMIAREISKLFELFGSRELLEFPGLLEFPEFLEFLEFLKQTRPAREVKNPATEAARA
ncbi:MAG TPA: hypothetical protein ENJ18_00530 [Nannocystis exedens]|nr:hypothetical protein [Nannocystis exedens]